VQKQIDYNRLGRMANWFTVGLLLGGLIAFGAAEAQEWVVVSRTASSSYEARLGSFVLGRNDANEPIAQLTLRVRREGLVEFEKNYVRLTHCARGQGWLVSVDLNGRYRYHNDFIFGGGNAASIIAETICGLARPSQTY